MDPGTQQIFALAVEAHKAGELEKAKKLFHALLLVSPQDSQLHNFLGIIAVQEQRPDVAIRYFLEAIRHDPNHSLYHANLAAAFLQTKRSDKALAAAKDALLLDPNFPPALLSSGVALLSLNRAQESVDQLQHLVALHPDHVEGAYNLGKAFMKLKIWDEAERWFRKAIELSPTHLKALVNLSICLLQAQHNGEAAVVCERIFEIDPKHLAARFMHCFAILPLLYKTEEEMVHIREQYEQELVALYNLSLQSTVEELAKAQFCIGLCQPFWLTYQGENDRKLQALYGDIVALFMKARYPKWVKPPIKRNYHKRIRVGIVSAYFKLHSNWKTHLRGWIKQINRKDFALFGYYLDEDESAITNEARQSFESFTVGLKTLKEWATLIEKDDLDILIFPEIGMDPMTMRLAALRLAPVQCSSGGHPETSGLHTIDFFLSSDLMEPSDGDAYYTEKLVRLPNLSMYYDFPNPSSIKRLRSDFGLREDAILYWCCQTPMKYRPQDDQVFIRIAQEVPNAQFVFVESMPIIAEEFRNRLEKAFAHAGLFVKDHCVFFPRLDGKEFEELSSLMDIFLDSVGWSGCNSLLESLPYDLPIATFPGKTMRSRHTAAILTMMGMKDYVSHSFDDYINRAIALGKHSEERVQMRARLAANKHRVYCDESTIKGLEEFLKGVVKNK